MKRLLVTAGMLGAFALAAAAPAAAQDGKALFDKQCVSCHGAAGKGDGPAAKALKTKPTDYATALKGKSDADIATTIKEGTVAGKPGHPKGAKLAEGDVDALVKYVKQLGGL